MARTKSHPGTTAASQGREARRLSTLLEVSQALSGSAAQLTLMNGFFARSEL